MNTAVRFPVKSCPEIFWSGVILHLTVCVITLLALSGWWVAAILEGVVAISLLITIKQYHSVTTSENDLCWTGESWSMSSIGNRRSIDYLQLKTSSWMTEGFCLLKFDSASQEKVWLFTKKHLGERTYRELCYLVMRDLNLSNKRVQ